MLLLFADKTYAGFVTNGTFNSDSIRSIYTLKTADNQFFTMYALQAIHILVCLFKSSGLFGEYKLKNIEDLLENVDSLFLGALFIRLCLVKDRSMSHVSLVV